MVFTIDGKVFAKEIKEKIKLLRSIKVNGKEIEFSGGFKDLHTEL